MSRMLTVSAIAVSFIAGTLSTAGAVPPSKPEQAPADAGTAAPAEAAKAPEPAKAQSAAPPASPAADKPPAAGGGMATAADIKAKIVGNTVIGSMVEGGAYTEFYDADGSVVGSDYMAKWSLEGNKMCFVYDESKPKDCLDVQIKDAKVSWIKFAVEIGSGNIVPGNPSKLMGAAAVPEAPAPEATAPAAKSEKFDLAAQPCSELVATFDPGPKQDPFGVKAVMYWMAGYTSPDAQGTVYDAKVIKADTERIVAQCRKQPKMGVLTIATKLMGEKVTTAGRNAVDIAALACKAFLEKAGSSKQSDKDETALILIWLAGFHSYYNQSTIMDSAVFGSSAENIGKFCSENPETSLVTAAKTFMAAEKK